MVAPHCAERLSRPQKQNAQTLQGIGPSPVRPKFQTEFCFFSALNPKALVTKIISSNLSCTETACTPHFEKLKLQLAHPAFNKPAKEDLLLGASVWPHLFKDTHSLGEKSLPHRYWHRALTCEPSNVP